MTSKKLGELSKGSKAVIQRISGSTAEENALVKRLLEFGFLEGSLVEIVHEAPVSKDPIAVRVRGSLVGLRRSEANLIEVGLL